MKTYNDKAEKHLAEGSCKILLMDDEEMIRELASDILTSLGYDVVLSEDGEHTIELYRSAMNNGSPFDAVIMDLAIPGGMGGKETIKKLLKLDPGVRAIVSSGDSNDPMMVNYKEYGFSGILRKPYRTEELSQLLFSMLDKKNPSR